MIDGHHRIRILIAASMLMDFRARSSRVRPMTEGHQMRPDIYWINGPWPGRLAIVPRPRGDDWLEDEIAAWSGAGLNVIVSTLTPEEETEFALHGEGGVAQSAGILYRSLRI